MKVYRIAKNQYIHDLSGEGARLYGGRWNRPGQRVLYTAQSRALAALECLVHLPLHFLPPDMSIAEIELPSGAVLQSVNPAELAGDWNTFPPPGFLADITGKWLSDGANLGLIVPSAVVSGESNCLINPAHPQFELIKITEIAPFNFDSRLLRNT
ncbi:RES family NAD+ phosphorylase [Myxococcota bacterium]|nr:RES family NAD+ phosphorylase [Myxococcota bacterium]MBU1381076.1 RES family NAD+ phosphorylase [Myxococcota bacterium]MBU1496322.1 RES family NAD+ phosphorylase [Myxococcota bacterium]